MPNIAKYPQHPDGWPQHDAQGFFVGESRDHGGPQPNNTAPKDDWPEFIPGFIPRRKAGEPQGWDQVEDHRGKTGYLGSEQFTVTEPGPLPEEFSEYPELTADAIDADALAYVQGELSALQVQYLTADTLAGLALDDEDAKALYAEYLEQAAIWRDRLAAVPASGEVAA